MGGAAAEEAEEEGTTWLAFELRRLDLYTYSTVEQIYWLTGTTVFNYSGNLCRGRTLETVHD